MGLPVQENCELRAVTLALVFTVASPPLSRGFYSIFVVSKDNNRGINHEQRAPQGRPRIEALRKRLSLQRPTPGPGNRTRVARPGRAFVMSRQERPSRGCAPPLSRRMPTSRKDVQGRLLGAVLLGKAPWAAFLRGWLAPSGASVFSPVPPAFWDRSRCDRAQTAI